MNASGYPMKMRVQRDFSSDEEGDSAADSEEDMITHFPINLHGVQGSTNGRAALLLEENMAHIHALQEDIQKMRSITAGRRLVEKTVQRRYTRLSTSCPSLNQDSDDDSWPADAAPLPAIQITAHANDGVGSNMSSVSTAVAGGLAEDGRQPSSCWSPRERRQAAAADTAAGRLRNSVSLSSLDSDQEESGRCHRSSPRNHDEKRLGVSTTGISSSTQDLRSSAVSSVSDAQSKRSRSSVGDTRIKIQKSLSTPSILGSRDGTEVDSGKLSRGLLSNESDDDDERPELLVHTAPVETFVRDPSFLEDGRKQRRKRSSIFFRKKKDKEKAKKSTQSLTLLQRGSQAVASGRWLNNNSTSSAAGAANALGPPKVSPPITDFGRSKSASDMEDPLLQYDTSNFPDTFDPPMAILSDCSVDDPDLRLLDEESEAWSGSVDRKILKALTEKQIKRQEHVYEFIMTEKHHCVTLKVMQRIFADGMQRELGYSVEMIQRLFPRLDDLLSVHMTFLRHLRQRQREALYVEQFGDLLLRDFAGEIGDNMRSCYGEFCSKHTESVALYKELLKSDRRFQDFIRRCSFNPLLKKKGVPECILFVTHRVTKYPLLIEPLIKTSRDREHEIAHLTKALQLVKEILVDVNSQVAEKQKEARLLEIYNKIEAKSTAFYRGNKFKKSDLLSANRKLMFEGSAALMQARGRPLPVQVVVMSDVVFFLQESNQKYHFVSQDGKAGIVSLQRLLVRDRAGGDSRGIYLISNVNEPGMYEMDCTMPRDKRIWIEAISDAVKRCPYDVEETGEGDESRQQAEAQAVQVRQLSKLLRDKDLQLALLCEDKLRVQADLVELLAPQESRLQASVGFMARSYTHLVEAGLESTEARHMLTTAIQEAARLATVVFPVSGSLSRSASSVGEHHSNHYVSPALPKRAETFAGFDNNTTPVKRRVLHEVGIDEEEEAAAGDAALDSGEDAAPPAGDSSSTAAAAPPEQLQPPLSAGSHQTGEVEVRSETYHVAAVQLHHSLSTMLCLIAQTASNVDVLRSCLPADVSVGAGGTGESRLGVKLEELRNLQDRFTKEKTEWSRERDNQDKWIQDKRAELAKLQDQLREEQSDVARQRELLYRQLDALRSQGILLSPNLQVVTVPQPEGTLSPTAAPGSPPAVGAGGEEGGSVSSSVGRSSAAAVPSAGSHVKLKSSSSLVRRGGGPGGDGGGGSQPALPAHLLSSINQQKAAVTSQPAPRQELPMKLAKLSSSLSAPATASALASASLSASAAAPPAPAERRSVMTSPPSTTSSTAATAPASSSVQQMLPMKLSQEQRAAATSRGYQRLVSGAPVTAAGDPSPQRQQAQRTNTYPKMPCRPTPPRRPATTTVTTLVTHTATPSPPRPPPRQPLPTPPTPPTPASTSTSNQDSEEIMFF